LASISQAKKGGDGDPKGLKKQRILKRLRARLARMEEGGPGARKHLPLGIDALDQALPGGGLALGGLHEITGEPAPAGGFAARLLGRFASFGPIAWIAARNDLHAPGLAAFGLAPGRLILVRARGREARLWALEEALRLPAMAAAIAEVDRLTLTESRRLQLAAEAKGVTAFLLSPPSLLRQPSAALTRWRVRALPGGGAAAAPGRLDPDYLDSGAELAWEVELLRCRGGQGGHWRLEGGFGRDRKFRPGSAIPKDKSEYSDNTEELYERQKA
jgi:protein ImuA